MMEIKNKLKIITIALIMMLWTLTNLNTPLNGIINGIYFSCLLISIYLFKDKWAVAVIVNLGSQLVLIAIDLFKGVSLANAVGEIGINICIMIIALVVYLVTKGKYTTKDGSAIRNTNIYTKVIIYSLVIITTMAFTGGDNSLILAGLYVSTLPWLITITLVLHLMDFYIANIVYIVIGLYICFMQYSLGVNTHILTITYLIILSAIIYEFKAARLKE